MCMERNLPTLFPWDMSMTCGRCEIVMYSSHSFRFYGGAEACMDILWAGMRCSGYFSIYTGLLKLHLITVQQQQHGLSTILIDKCWPLVLVPHFKHKDFLYCSFTSQKFCISSFGSSCSCDLLAGSNLQTVGYYSLITNGSENNLCFTFIQWINRRYVFSSSDMCPMRDNSTQRATTGGGGGLITYLSWQLWCP